MTKEQKEKIRDDIRGAVMRNTQSIALGWALVDFLKACNDIQAVFDTHLKEIGEK